MRCPGCQRPNPDDARFCNGCGQRMDAAQPARDPRAYTPRHLAERILTSRSALEGERKQVTVLFADIHGSMELAERVDPEAWHRLLDRFFAICTDAVHRFEGTVNQYTGDGIMALFGAPIAHEDHAARACHAALRLRDELHAFADELRRTDGLGLACRVGLNSGEVVVGKIGDDLRMDYTAQGHTVGLAQRVEQLAEPGRVYLTEHTAALVAGLFELRDLGRVALKGARAPIAVHELLRPGRLRTRFDQSRARGLSRFIGRDDQRDRLEAALARAGTGEGGVVGIVGDAGVGKSRLCWELAERCRAAGVDVAEGRAVAHGANVPFLPLLELLRSMFGVGEDDPAAVARQKIAGALLLLDDGFRTSLPLVFDFLGVAEPTAPRPDPARQRLDLVDFLTHLIPARARLRPGLVLCEDLHWIDPATDAVLAHLVATVAGTRTLVVVNTRPGYHAAWMEQPGYQEIALAPLGPEAIDALLEELLGRDASCRELATLIRERTGGNPFFVEEVVQSLVESGTLGGVRGAHRLARPVAQLTIPATVQAVLAARIDRLAERDKRVLATAAVVGKEVRRSVLARVAELPDAELDAALAALVRAELLVDGPPQPDPLVEFRHPLTQEVAYHAQLAERRRHTHAAVARAIGEQAPDRQGERAALLAHHWEAAGNALEAARAHYLASGWLGPRDVEDGLRHCRRVCELLAGVPESPETIHLGISARGRIVSFSARGGASQAALAAVMGEMRALAARTDDPRLHLEVASSERMVGGMSGDAETLVEQMRKAVQLADHAGDVGAGFGLRFALAIALAFSGRLREALALIEATLATAPSDLTVGASTIGFSPGVALVMQRGLLQLHLGDPATGARTLARAAELAQGAGETEVLGWTRGAQSTHAWFMGDPGTALERARQAVEIAHTVGGSLSIGQAYESLGQALVLAEQWDEGAAALERAIATVREHRTFFDDEAHLLSRLAEAQLGQGNVARARATAAEAVALAQERRAGWAAGSTQIILARMLRHDGGVAAHAAIAAALDVAAASIARSGARALEPLLQVEIAELARLTGDQAGWRRALAHAQRLCAEIGFTGRAAWLAARLDGTEARP